MLKKIEEDSTQVMPLGVAQLTSFMNHPFIIEFGLKKTNSPLRHSCLTHTKFNLDKFKNRTQFLFRQIFISTQKISM